MTYYVATRKFRIRSEDGGTNVEINAGAVISITGAYVYFPTSKAAVWSGRFQGAIKSGWLLEAEADEDEFGDVLSVTVKPSPPTLWMRLLSDDG